MKKTKHYLLIIFAILLGIISFACRKEKNISDVVLSSSSLTLLPNETAFLTAIIYPTDVTNKNVTWNSSNLRVATVENGWVMAISEGTALITVTTEIENITANCKVTVNRHPAEPEMVFVEGGTFIMGCSDSICNNKDLPQHQVTLSSFKISKYPVTQKQWETIMRTSPPNVPQGDNMPITKLFWDDTQYFINKLNKITGKNYRLPTEAEWEFAARGGNKSEGYRYSGSDNLDEVAWYAKNGYLSVHPLGQKKPNELGIYDMSGNYDEWCNNWYEPYSEIPQINPIGQENGIWRILRGGGHTSSPYECSVWARLQRLPDEEYGTFRLVLTCDKDY